MFYIDFTFLGHIKQYYAYTSSEQISQQDAKIQYHASVNLKVLQIFRCN
jgi:hypothetical protein